MTLTFSSQSKGSVSSGIDFSYQIAGLEAIKIPPDSPVVLEAAVSDLGG